MLGDTDGGGFAGFLNLITGVRGGGNMLTYSPRIGEEPTVTPESLVAPEWFGLISWDELRIRAISSSARPRLIRGGSMSKSEVKI